MFTCGRYGKYGTQICTEPYVVLHLRRTITVKSGKRKIKFCIKTEKIERFYQKNKAK